VVLQSQAPIENALALAGDVSGGDSLAAGFFLNNCCRARGSVVTEYLTAKFGSPVLKASPARRRGG